MLKATADDRGVAEFEVAKAAHAGEGEKLIVIDAYDAHPSRRGERPQTIGTRADGKPGLCVPSVNARTSAREEKA